MAVQTEGRWPQAFILSEAPGSGSRQNGTLVSGQNCEAGQVLMATGALDSFGDKKLTAITMSGTSSDLDGAVAGILLYNVDATDGDTRVSYLDRNAEVNMNELVYTTSTDGEETKQIKDSLLLLGIKGRDDIEPV